MANITVRNIPDDLLNKLRILSKLEKRSLNNETNLKPAVTKTLGLLSTAIIIFCMGYILHHEFDKWGIFTTLGW